MPNDSLSQQALARDPHFHRRVASSVSNVAWQVMEEPISTADHERRVAFARQVLSNVEQAARTIAPWLVERPNLLAFETSYDFSAAAVVTAAGDPDIQAQLMSDWNDLAGALSGGIPAGTGVGGFR